MEGSPVLLFADDSTGQPQSSLQSLIMVSKLFDLNYSCHSSCHRLSGRIHLIFAIKNNRFNLLQFRRLFIMFCETLASSGWSDYFQSLMVASVASVASVGRSSFFFYSNGRQLPSIRFPFQAVSTRLIKPLNQIPYL